MTAERVPAAYPLGAWSSFVRRVDPLLDPVIAVVATALALASPLTTDVDAIDPRLHGPEVFAAAPRYSRQIPATRRRYGVRL